ncbi:PP2C family protein-serine/threonine phosphatase [Streptomyces cacaoi]|uniref:PP2C family protein-serine/threonine phosphatase n=1 Tax=Streptomyces cacaoi TaxID=1898 RepID=UPI00332060BD
MAEQDITLGRLLAAVEERPPVESVAVIARVLGEDLGASDVGFLLADFGGDAIWRLPTFLSPEAGRQGRIELPGTVYDRVIRSQRPQTVDSPEEGCVRVYTPVANRGDVMGVLEVCVAEQPDDGQMRHMAQAALALAYVVTTSRRFTDMYEWGRRIVSPTLAAEIQQNLLPDTLCCEAGNVTVAAALEPALTIAGDTFDYSLDRDTLHLSITDAMGHDTGAALLATLVVGALRNTRRARATLAEQALAAHHALLEHGNGGTVTGQIMRVDLASGRCLFVNAGHPWPLRRHEGRVAEVHPAVDLPFGAPHQDAYRVQHLDLAPGDRLVLLTDGMLERSASELDLPALIERDSGLHPREAVRSLTRELREITGGDLRDDATVICLDWYGTELPAPVAAARAEGTA